MPDQPFVINDRRKFTAEGDLRPDAPPSEPKPAGEEASATATTPDVHAPGAGPRLVHAADPANALTDAGPGSGIHEAEAAEPEGQAPPPLTAEQTQQATTAYNATVDRLDTAIRASNPAMGPIPEMTFERLVQSIYMQTLMQLGLAGEPESTPQVDLLGARSSIDMLGIIEQKTKANLTEAEQKLLEAALFEMRMGFLEITQALARQAASRQPPPGTPPGPSIVR